MTERALPAHATSGRSADELPLAGFRVGVTAARKVDEQVALLERRGAAVTWAPALSTDPNHVDEAELRAATLDVLSRPVDMFLATTGIGMKTWFETADGWGLSDDLVEALARSEILARGPKSVGALRRRGLRELWAPESECFEDVLQHLRGRELAGRRIVVQEHGQSLSMVAHALRRRGADVTVVTVYRVAGADDPEPMFEMIELIAERRLDAVTFTSAPAVAALMDAAGSAGHRDDVVSAFQADVVAACVGPVTAAAFELWGVPTVLPDRSRLAAMVKLLETELPARRDGLSLKLADGQVLLLHGDDVLLVGVGPAVPGSCGRPAGAGGQPRSRRAARGAARAAAVRHRGHRPRGRHGGRAAAGGPGDPCGADRGQARLPARRRRARVRDSGSRVPSPVISHAEVIAPPDPPRPGWRTRHPGCTRRSTTCSPAGRVAALLREHLADVG